MKEQILFANPVSIIKARNPSQDIHWHENFEMMTVLKGLLNLQIGFEKLILKEGDVMIINSLESHSLASLEKDTEVLFLSLDKESCLKINSYFYESIAIVDYSVGFAQLQECQEKVTKSIVALLQSLPPEDFNGSIDKTQLRVVHERMAGLLHLLSTVYKPRVFKNGVLATAPEEKINMLYRMIRYLYANYNKNPNLDDFLKKEHYSLYHMSHVIVEITGTSFRDWLTYVRVEESEKILLARDAPISCVAHEVGFSSVRYYNANFKKWYGMTPTDFRRLFKRNYDESLKTPSGDLIVARNFLWNYLDHHSDSLLQPREQNPENDNSADTLHIRMKANGDDNTFTAYPQQECMIHFSELSRPDRWEHLMWAQNEIGFGVLRILVPFEGPANKLPEKQVDLIKQFSGYVQKKHREFPASGNLKISVETTGATSPQKHTYKPFTLLRPRLPLDSLITAEGHKTPEFFFYSLLSLFKGQNVMVTPWSLVAKSGDRLLVFIVRQEAFSMEHQLKEVKICINGIRGDYKLTTYKCDLDFFYNDMPVKDIHILNCLTPSDYKRLNMMYEPRVTFELISFQNRGEVKARIMGNSCQLLVFDPIKSITRRNPQV